MVMIFLYLPLITLMAFSFNDGRRNIVWQGFTLKYYEKALNNDSLVGSLSQFDDDRIGVHHCSASFSVRSPPLRCGVSGFHFKTAV